MAWTDRLVHPAVRDRVEPQHAPTVESRSTGFSFAEIEALTRVEEDRRGFVEGAGRGGFGITTPKPSGQSHIERHLLYQVYLQESWVSACIELIARRVTSGGIDLEPTVDRPDEASRDALVEWFEWCNPYENFRDVCMSAVRGMLVWGDAYWEVTRANQKPLEIYTLDPLTVDKIASRQGDITGYLQWDEDPASGVNFKAEEVVNFKMATPRGGLYGISPTRRLLLPTTIDLFAQSWNRTSMKNGSTGVKVIEMPETTDENIGRRMLRYVRENFSGARNAGKDMVMWGGAKVSQVGQNHTEMSYLEGRKFTREEILAVYGVSGHMLGLPEVGSLGGGPAIEASERAFYMNTVEPIQGIILEQLNFNIIDGAPGSFGIKDWRIQFKNPDYRDSLTRAQEADLKTKGGVWTTNEARVKSNDGDDRKPLEGGDVAVIEFRGNLIPVHELPNVSYLISTGEADVAGPSSAPPSTALSPLAGGARPTAASPKTPKTAASPKTPKTTKQSFDALKLWEKKSLRRLRDGRSPAVGFESEHVEPALRIAVERELAAVGVSSHPEAADVRAAFERALQVYEKELRLTDRQAAVLKQYQDWDRARLP